MSLVLLALVAMAPKPDPVVVADKAQTERLWNGPMTDEDVRLLVRKVAGLTPACLAKLRAGGLNAMPKRTEECRQMTPPRRWKGLWRADFEGSQFCAVPAKMCNYEPYDKRTTDDVWLSFRSPLPAFYAKHRYGGLYSIEFIGRRTVVPDRYGHMGMFDAEILVDRLISIKKIEPPPTRDAK